eukprot:g7085.t1
MRRCVYFGCVYSSRNMPDLWQVVCSSAVQFANNVAYVDADGPCTYAQVLAKVKRLSASLSVILKAGPQRLKTCFTFCLTEENAGEEELSFSVLLPNCPTHVDLFFAAAATRAKVVCLNHRLTTEELQVLFERGHSPLLIASEGFSMGLGEVHWASTKIHVIAWVFDIPDDFSDPMVKSHSLADLYASESTFQPPPLAEDTGLQGFFTSGSTGTPKSVTHTHKIFGFNGPSLAEQI